MIGRVIVAGGGTGGHLFPGLAVIEELRRRQPSLEVLFVGTSRGIEARVLPMRGERLEVLDVQPLKGRGPGALMRSLGVLPGAVGRAAGIVRGFRPDLVLGVGGYAAGPVLAAAAALGKPTALLEQNAHVGLTNRLLAPMVGRAYVTFPDTARRFPARNVRVCGNPVRRAFVHAARRAATDPAGFEARSRGILVLGGSQGARSLNEVVPEALARLSRASGARIVHQTGVAMETAVRQRYAELGCEAEVVSFIDDMARAYADAAVVIARAGATTVAELCAVGRPSVLVPYPHAADDHQRKNGDALAADGAAVCVPESELSVERLQSELSELLGDTEARRRMAEAARRLGRPDAAAAIVDDLCDWLGCPEVTEGEPDGDMDRLGEAGEAEPGPAASTVGPGRGLRGRRPYAPPCAFTAGRVRVWVADHPTAGRRPLVAATGLLE
jgi:UDP-N-acetylglucosamine--N-acetylmuramyl-(pentapeptide) pyrophosphoryl-undecaprenol N-acetylglucosamine transferase